MYDETVTDEEAEELTVQDCIVLAALGATFALGVYQVAKLSAEWTMEGARLIQHKRNVKKANALLKK